MNLNYLKDKHKNSFLQWLQKYEEMLNETLGKYTGSDYTKDFKQDAKYYHGKYFPTPKMNEPTLKKQVYTLIK